MSVAYLTPDQLADRYQVPVATVYQWRTKRYGPVGIRIGRHLRYRLSDIEKWERDRFAEASA